MSKAVPGEAKWARGEGKRVGSWAVRGLRSDSPSLVTSNTSFHPPTSGHPNRRQRTLPYSGSEDPAGHARICVSFLSCFFFLLPSVVLKIFYLHKCVDAYHVCAGLWRSEEGTRFLESWS